MSNLDLDAIESAGATLTCCRDRCSICGRKSWCGGHAMGDSACTCPGSIECRAVAAVRTLRADLAARDNLIADLRCCLAAARLDAANARAVAVEACALLDARLNARSLADYVFHDEANERMASLRTRLASPADFAARVTAALDRLVDVAASEFPGSPKIDAARADLYRLLGLEAGR